MKSDPMSPTWPNNPGFDSLPFANGIYFDAAVHRRLALKGDCPGASDYAVLAARQALEMSGLNRFRSELVIGAAFGSGRGDAQRWLYAREAGDLQDFIFRTADSVTADLELNGPTFEVSTACAASGYAIAMAETVLRSGEADVMVWMRFRTSARTASPSPDVMSVSMKPGATTRASISQRSSRASASAERARFSGSLAKAPLVHRQIINDRSSKRAELNVRKNFIKSQLVSL